MNKNTFDQSSVDPDLENVTELKPNQVFVFGSNIVGNHAGGAARQAKQWGAQDGIGVGMAGQTYAIPTMSGEEVLVHYYKEFLSFAKLNLVARKDLEFLLTPIGTGIAGYTLEDIKKLGIGDHLPSNVTKIGKWD